MMQPKTISKNRITAAEAFYRLFCALPKKDRLAVARSILANEDVRRNFELPEIPNDVTLQAFAEDKTRLPVFESLDDLRRDVLS